MPDQSDVTPDLFPVLATASLQEADRRVLKDGETFGLFERSGDVAGVGLASGGLYHRDTRHLSLLRLSLWGRSPVVLASEVREDNSSLTCDLTNPDLQLPDGSQIGYGLVHLRRTKFLQAGAMHESLSFRTYTDRPVLVPVRIQLAADFADLFEIRGTPRRLRGKLREQFLTDSSIVVEYIGLDETTRITKAIFTPIPASISRDGVEYQFALAPNTVIKIYAEVRFELDSVEADARHSYYSAVRATRRAVRRADAATPSVVTSNALFNEIVRRSFADLRILKTEMETGPYPFAGVPWFSAPFGRDAIITALFMLWADPSIAAGVLRFLAANQATAHDPSADADPGKILHEARSGEMAALGEVPFRRYYGSVDSTPLFVMLAGAYYERTADQPTIRALWPAILAALGWIERFGDGDGDGYVEYHRMTDEGLANQGWKDSHDSVSHADGSAVEGPIRLVEVQGYAFAAFEAASKLAFALGEHNLAARYAARAAALGKGIESAFWSEELGSYGLALDGQRRLCAVRSSNAGHLLLSGAIDAERAARVAEHLLDNPMFTGWGIRTLDARERRYNPMSYHNGSVWPHDNALCALGLRRYGHARAAARICEAMVDAATSFDLRRLPELFCGFTRRRGQGPVAYPVACAPQAWAAAAIPALLQACLGMRFVPAERLIRFEAPVMPRFADAIILHGLRVGGAELDVMLSGRDEAVTLSVLRARGGRAELTGGATHPATAS